MTPADTDTADDSDTEPSGDTGASADQPAPPEFHPPIDPDIRVDEHLFGPDEIGWARYMLVGVIAGIIAWAIILTGVVYALEDEVGLGGAIGAAMVPGIFGGLFFGGTVAGFTYAIRHPEH